MSSISSMVVAWGPLATIYLLDMQNLLSWNRRKILPVSNSRCYDFTVLIPIFGDPRYFAERNQIKHLKTRTLVVIECTYAKMRKFADQVEKEGWKVHRVRIGKQVRVAQLISRTLADDVITTAYVIRMDADSRPRDNLSRQVAAMKADGADICSTKVYIANPRTWPQRFQALEYRMAMLSRHYRPWLTSGGCHFARTAALSEIYRHHTLLWPNEDTENGMIAISLKMRVRHLDTVVYTDAPATWRALFRQRRLWWGGMSRIVVNIDKVLLHWPVWIIYVVGFVYTGLALKWHNLINIYHFDWTLLPLWVLASWFFYALLTFTANLQVRTPMMLLFPLYSMFQILVMPAVGFAWYLRHALRIKSIGRYRFGWRNKAVSI